MEVFQIKWLGSSSNCYLLYSEDSREGVVVDPGAYPDRILKAIEEKGLNVKNIILTHGHGDHIGAVSALKESLKARVMAHEDEKELLENADLNLSPMIHNIAIEVKPDVLLKDGDIIEIEDLKIKVIHTPGHTKGGICLDTGNGILTGDTLFAGSVGRSDLPCGDGEALIEGIVEKLMVYPDETVIYPGHQGYSTIGKERRTNIFLQNRC